MFVPKKINMRDNVISSWNTLIKDSDWHTIINTLIGKVNKKLPIIIGNNMWLGAKSIVLNGFMLASACIVCANTLVSGRFEKKLLHIRK